MLEYENGIVIMDLVDLEHCGFIHDDFDWELSAVGEERKEARWPVAVLVSFSGGCITTASTTAEEREIRRMNARKFKEIKEEVLRVGQNPTRS